MVNRPQSSRFHHSVQLLAQGSWQWMEIHRSLWSLRQKKHLIREGKKSFHIHPKLLMDGYKLMMETSKTSLISSCDQPIHGDQLSS